MLLLSRFGSTCASFSMAGHTHFMCCHSVPGMFIRSTSCFGLVYASVSPVTSPSFGTGSLHRCVIGQLQGASVWSLFLRGLESLQQEAPNQLFGNGGSIPCLSPVPEFNLTPLGFAEMQLYYSSCLPQLMGGGGGMGYQIWCVGSQGSKDLGVLWPTWHHDVSEAHSVHSQME